MMDTPEGLDPSFMFDGECQKADDPEIFFKPPRSETTEERESRDDSAKAFCKRCGVKEECLNWALDTGQTDGIWGELSEEERRPLHLERAQQGHPSRVTLPTGDLRKSL